MEKKVSKEIDVIDILKRVFIEWRLLIKVIVVATIIGIVIALNTEKKYTTTVILAPELSTGSQMGSSLSSIASMVGVNLGNGANGIDAIYPQIYPDVLTSSDFILHLFDVKVKKFEEPKTMSYYNYLTSEKSIPFWSYPSIWLSQLFTKKDSTNNNVINKFSLTKRQDIVLNEIRSNIACIIDKNTSIITISVTDADKQVSAIMADTIQKQLQEYITIYKTKKARMDLAYAEKLYHESKAQYIQAQQKYSAYSDANTDIILEAFKAKREELENEMQLKYNIYTQTVQQLQIAKAKVQEQTPAFSVIQSASIPLKASSTPRSFIVLLYVFLGFVFDALWVGIFRDAIKKAKEEKLS